MAQPKPDTQPKPDKSSGKITPDGIQRYRNRIGVLIKEGAPFNQAPHKDTIRHFAHAYGDDNPIFCDEDYAQTTRWAGIVAPPTYLLSLDNTGTVEIPKEVRSATSGALRGVPNYLAGGSYELIRPVQPGDKVHLNHFVEDVEETNSEFGGGRALIVRHRKEYINQHEEMVAIRRFHFFYVEREASQKASKNTKTYEPPNYTDDYLALIDEAYENEFRRGPNTLYWEDVEPAMEMPRMVKGPLQVQDIIAWHMGMGWGMFRNGVNRLDYLNRKRIPSFYNKTKDGAWSTTMRVHWDDERAKEVGNPRAYDYAFMRTSWMMHYLTNWVGDDGFVWELADEARIFNFHGDTTWVNAKVVSKSQEDQRNMVELEIWCENQRGEVTAPGRAKVLLPSRARGPVIIPATDIKPSPLKTQYAVDTPGCVW
ncbi:MAG: MaoC family dehydratase N-terminal domain-containing protein [bacterium]|nr:MaoC family dehydratase N-terminal domain-containing protein [bacterium]